MGLDPELQKHLDDVNQAIAERRIKESQLASERAAARNKAERAAKIAELVDAAMSVFESGGPGETRERLSEAFDEVL
jgi:uncharacterized protein (DUF2384 family)